MANTIIAVEPLTRWWREAAERGLFEDHWREVEPRGDTFIANPDFERWLLLERAGALRCFTVRVGGELVGYAGFTFVPDPIYRDHTVAQNVVLYVKPDRRGVTGVRFMQFIERELAAEGAEKICYLVPVGMPHDKTFDGLGYPVAQVQREKVLV